VKPLRRTVAQALLDCQVNFDQYASRLQASLSATPRARLA
jgi:hypothetical protein